MRCLALDPSGIRTSTGLSLCQPPWNREDDERITPLEALECYTLGSAAAEFCEKEKGSISVGKYADFVVLSDDVLTVDPTRIKDISVKMTVAGGRVIHDQL